MKPTISTTAFDALVVAEPDLCIWTARGFVSDEICGFDLLIASARSGAPEEFPGANQWWDAENLDEGFPMELLADDIRLPLRLDTAGGTSEGGTLRSFISVVFPTPAGCSGLRLSVHVDVWSIQRTVAFDPAEFRAALTRWAGL